RRPTWSPNGRKVAFIRDSASGGDVWARAADGGGAERRLTHSHRAIQEVSWSKDGKWLLVRTETGAAGNGEVLREVLGDVPIQRCQWHKRENVVRYLAKQQQPAWRRKLQAAYAHPAYADAKRALDRLYRELRLV